MEGLGRTFVIQRSLLEPNSSVTDQHYTSGAPSRDRILANVIYHVIMSAVTTTGNGLALLAWIRNPLKCFRTPPSFLVMSMTVANLLVSLVVEPMYSAFYYIFLVKDFQLYGDAFTCYEVGVDTSAVAFNTSFIIVFVMSLDLYFALSRPLKYCLIVTKKAIFSCLALIWSYTTLFALLPIMGLSMKIYLRIDLFLNTVLFFVLLLASYVALLKSFKKQRQNAMKLRPNANLSKESTRKGQLARERKFVVAIFIQVLLVSITALPNMIFMITEFYCIKCKFNQKMTIVRNILQNIVLLKFAADPFIYAWRIPRYRRALQLAVRCNKGPRVEVRMVLHHEPMKGTNI